MTENEWQSCSDPEAMLDWLRQSDTVSDRKFRLFGCACCRRIWRFLDEAGRGFVEILERYVDRKANQEEVENHFGGNRAEDRNPIGCSSR
ncbi:MAG: hypothetical protein AB7K24_30865 [Gemmataceae bacterium]